MSVLATDNPPDPQLKTAPLLFRNVLPAVNPPEPLKVLELINSPETVSVAEVELNVPATKVNGPLSDMAELPPWNNPPACEYPPAPIVNDAPVA
jgi:hypothetical protein